MKQSVVESAPVGGLLKRDRVVFEGRSGVGVVAKPGAGAEPVPSLRVLHEDETKQIIEVRCHCGERVRILCQFGAAPQAGPIAS